MRLAIPLTGTVLVEGPVHGAGDLTGDDKDPVRPIEINLGNVSWKMVDIDLENEVMLIELEAGKKVVEPDLDEQGKQKTDPDTGRLLWITRPATDEESLGFLQYAQKLLESKTRDELYQMSGCPRLKRPLN